ncbi:hypothetical protein BH20ACT2_BH20ACT2_15350 [soil metagenome]
MLATVLAALVVALMVAPAVAQTYPPPAEGITISNTTVVPGQSVTVTATGYAPGTAVGFVFLSDPVDLGSVTADANGVARLTFNVPADADPGEHTVTASGLGADGSPLVQSVNLTVVGPDGAAGGQGTGRRPLPRTGTDASIGLGQLGAGLLAAGGIAVLAARKRRVHTTA